MSTKKGCMRHAFPLVATAFFLACCFPIEEVNANSMESKRHKEFLELFDYEVQNRAFALIALQTLAEKEDDPVRKGFWDAYLALERLNQEKYEPFTKSYGITQEPGFTTSLKASMLVFTYGWFPSYTLKTMHKATVQHVGKLEKMAALADEKDMTFFAYVVSQERIQAEAMLLMINGMEQKAAQLVADFVAKHDAT